MVPYANQRGLDGGFSGRHYMAMSRHPLYNQSHPAASNLSKRESKSKSKSKKRKSVESAIAYYDTIKGMFHQVETVAQ